MKNKEEIIAQMKSGLDRGMHWHNKKTDIRMHKFYFNALLFALDREDLIPKTFTAKAKKRILEELEK